MSGLPAGLEAQACLAGAVLAVWGLRVGVRWVTAAARWWPEQRREEAAWRAQSEPAYAAELAAAAAERAAREETRQAQSAARVPDARALRPTGTPIDILKGPR